MGYQFSFNSQSNTILELSLQQGYKISIREAYHRADQIKHHGVHLILLCEGILLAFLVEIRRPKSNLPPIKSKQ